MSGIVGPPAKWLPSNTRAAASEEREGARTRRKKLRSSEKIKDPLIGIKISTQNNDNKFGKNKYALIRIKISTQNNDNKAD